MKELKQVLLVLTVLLNIQIAIAGPPFDTDDPEPVEFKHWEYYISSINNHQSNTWSGTAPHIEMNYGVVPNVQIHLLLPMNYAASIHAKGAYGFADTEFGIKFRFVQEKDNRPQIGIFPIVEIPTIKNNEFSDGKAKIYLPVWIQKSWSKFTTYGGAGYWINPGSNNKNWIFAGWELQYDFSKFLMLGGELYYHTATVKNDNSSMGFNMGGSLNPSEKFHLIFSFGHTVTSDNAFTSYIGLLWTI